MQCLLHIVSREPALAQQLSIVTVKRVSSSRFASPAIYGLVYRSGHRPAMGFKLPPHGQHEMRLKDTQWDACLENQDLHVA